MTSSSFMTTAEQRSADPEGHGEPTSPQAIEEQGPASFPPSISQVPPAPGSTSSTTAPLNTEPEPGISGAPPPPPGARRGPRKPASTITLRRRMPRDPTTGTRACYDFNHFGHCPHGDKCSYAHILVDVKVGETTGTTDSCPDEEEGNASDDLVMGERGTGTRDKREVEPQDNQVRGATTTTTPSSSSRAAASQKGGMPITHQREGPQDQSFHRPPPHLAMGRAGYHHAPYQPPVAAMGSYATSMASVPSPPLCYFEMYHPGGCRNGANCPYAHVGQYPHEGIAPPAVGQSMMLSAHPPSAETAMPPMYMSPPPSQPMAAASVAQPMPLMGSKPRRSGTKVDVVPYTQVASSTLFNKKGYIRMPHDPQSNKVVCYYFNFGGCRLGESCLYAHVEVDKSLLDVRFNRPAAPPQQQQQQQPRRRSVLPEPEIPPRQAMLSSSHPHMSYWPQHPHQHHPGMMPPPPPPAPMHPMSSPHPHHMHPWG